VQRFAEGVCESVWDWTGGQPWLVNRLAKVMTQLYPDEREIPLCAVDEAVNALVSRRETHLDSLGSRLREERIQRVVLRLLEPNAALDVEEDPDVRECVELGVVAQPRHGMVTGFANRIYGRVFPLKLAGVLKLGSALGYSELITLHATSFLNQGGSLDVERVLDAWIVERFRGRVEQITPNGRIWTREGAIGEQTLHLPLYG